MKQPRFKTGDRVFVGIFSATGIVVSSEEEDDSTIPELNGAIVYRVYIPEFSRIIGGLLEKALDEPARESER